MSKHLEQKLVAIGLTDKEAHVYMSLLKMGRGSAYKVALVAGIKIPTTYLVLEELHKKGLVTKSSQSKSTVFFVQKPDKYIQEQKDKVLSIESSLALFDDIANVDTDSRTISYDGHEGIAQALEYRYTELKGKTLYSFYSHLPDPDPEVLSMYMDWGNRAIADKLSFKILVPDSQEIDTFITPRKEMYRGNTKTVSKKLWKPETSIEIIEDSFIRIISPKDLQATIIENKRVTQAMQQIFSMIWGSDMAKKLRV